MSTWIETMATRAATRAAAQGRVTRSGRVPQELIDAELTRALGQRDVRLRSLAPDARLREAKRRLGDPDTAAGRPGTNLCRFTGEAKGEVQTGKRPSFYTKKNVGRAGVALCADLVKEAWNDPAFLKEQTRVCGDDREYVFPYKRKGKTVKGHCRKLDAPRPRTKKVEQQPVRRAAPVRPAVGPPTRRPATSTRRAPTAITGPMQAFIDGLPRGERGKAANVMTAYRNFGNLEPGEAIARYMQRREDDARTPLDNAGEFEDELNTDDESDDDFGGGALGPGLQNLLENAEFRFVL